jgi:hypothetical protein
MSSNSSTLSHDVPSWYPTPCSIVVGNGFLLPVTSTGNADLASNLHLNNVLVSQLIKNLISVR